VTIAAVLALLAGCNGSPGAAGPDGGAPITDAAGPPQGQPAVEAWLAQGVYRQAPWRCEAMVSAPRLDGAHGHDRTCTNDVLLAADSAPYPVGAASVTEMFDGQMRRNGYAVGLKVAAGAGDETWYWYERAGESPTSRPVADGVGVEICGKACHADAPRDNVYFRAP
jgi:hypothetical protein